MDKKKVNITIISVEEIKSGKSTKDGKTFDWTLSKVTADLNGKTIYPSTFDDFAGKENMEVEVMIWEEENTGKDGKVYHNLKIETPKKSNVWDAVNQNTKDIAEIKKAINFQDDAPEEEQEHPLDELDEEIKIDEDEEFNVDDLPF